MPYEISAVKSGILQPVYAIVRTGEIYKSNTGHSKFPLPHLTKLSEHNYIPYISSSAERSRHCNDIIIFLSYMLE